MESHEIIFQGKADGKGLARDMRASATWAPTPHLVSADATQKNTYDVESIPNFLYIFVMILQCGIGDTNYKSASQHTSDHIDLITAKTETDLQRTYFTRQLDQHESLIDSTIIIHNMITHQLDYHESLIAPLILNIKMKLPWQAIGSKNGRQIDE